MLAHLFLLRFPRGSFMWTSVEGASAPATPFGSTRKVSCTREVSKEGSFGANEVFFYP